MSWLLKRLENLRETNDPTSSGDIESEYEDRPEWTEKTSTPMKLHSMSDYYDSEYGVTAIRSHDRSNAFAEVNSLLEDNWHLDELFDEQRVLNLSINQDELQSPEFMAPPERLYLPNKPGRMQLGLMAGYYKVNFDGQKANIFQRNKEIYAYPTPDLEEKLNTARLKNKIVNSQASEERVDS